MAAADTSEFLGDVPRAFIISSVNHCVMNPTFRERRSCLRRGKKRNEGKQGLRREWISRWLRRYGKHVSALIIAFPAVFYDWEILRRHCSERKSERGGGGREKREPMPSGTTTTMGDDGEQARGFWVGEQGEGSGWADMGQVTGSPWLRALLLPPRDRPSPIEPPPRAASQPLLSVSRSDMKMTTTTAAAATCPLYRTFDRRLPLSYLRYVILFHPYLATPRGWVTSFRA